MDNENKNLNNDINMFRKTAELLKQGYESGDIAFKISYRKVKTEIKAQIFQYPIAKEYTNENELKSFISDIVNVLNMIALGDISNTVQDDSRPEFLDAKMSILKEILIKDIFEEQLSFYTTSTSNVLDRVDWQIIHRQTKYQDVSNKSALLSIQYSDNKRDDSEETLVIELTKKQVEELIEDLKSLTDKI